MLSGPGFEAAEATGQGKTSARPAGADEMTLVDGESAMERALDRAVIEFRATARW